MQVPALEPAGKVRVEVRFDSGPLRGTFEHAVELDVTPAAGR